MKEWREGGGKVGKEGGKGKERRERGRGRGREGNEKQKDKSMNNMKRNM